jgi:hypothetical protein
MDTKKRFENEKKFGQWIEEKDGCRIYFYEVFGRFGWKAKYCKKVDIDEDTISFWQEIYDENNILKEIHDKFPEDKGHRRII